MAAGELKLSIRTYLLLLFHANPDMREARGFRAHFNDSLLSYTAAQITSLKGGSLGIGPSIQKFFCWDKRHHEDEHLMVKKVDDGSLDYSRLQKNLESLSKTFPPDAYRWFVRTLLSIVQQDSSIKEDWLSFVSPMIVEQYKKSSLNLFSLKPINYCEFHTLVFMFICKERPGASGDVDFRVEEAVKECYEGIKDMDDPSSTRSLREIYDNLFSDMHITMDVYAEYMDICVNQGLSGRMGRHSAYKAATRRDPNGLLALEIAELFFHGYGTKNDKPDYEKAKYFYNIAMEAGVPSGAWNLGYMLYRQLMEGTQENVGEEILGYLKKALRYDMIGDFRCIPAWNTLGYCILEKHFYSLNQLWNAGIERLTKEMEQLNLDGMREIDALEKIALRCFTIASEKNYHYATNRLGKYYYDKKCYEKSFEYFLRSTGQMYDGYAYNMVGQHFEKGLGIPKDLEKACRYYLLSANEIEQDQIYIFYDDLNPWGALNAARVRFGVIKGTSDYRDRAKAYELLELSYDLFLKPSNDSTGIKFVNPVCWMLEMLCAEEDDDLREANIKTAKRWIRAANIQCEKLDSDLLKKYETARRKFVAEFWPEYE